MSENLFTAPAGWYADPLGLPQLRWWNSEGWTEQVAEASAPSVAPQEPMMWQADQAPTPPPAPAPAPAPAAGPTLDQLQSPSVYQRVEDPSTYFAPSAMPVLQPGAYTILQPAAPEPEPIPVVSQAYSPRREARYNGAAQFNGYGSFDASAGAEQMARPPMTSNSIPVWDIDTEFSSGS